MDISFETKTWENDWELMIKTAYIERTVSRCGGSFSQRTLYINNVNNREKVKKMAEVLVARQVIDSIVLVDDHADAALHYFGLSREKLGKGYYYSIAELVSIYLCNTKYLLHFSGDTTVDSGISHDWLRHGVDVLERDENIKVFNLVWNNKYDEAKSESHYEDENFYFGYGFSDQMYLIRTDDFKQKIYEHYDAASMRYPEYGGELFEKRVDSWMRQKKYLRATFKHGSYIHKNFPKKNSIRWLMARCVW